jgi:hypothetical protein
MLTTFAAINLLVQIGSPSVLPSYAYVCNSIIGFSSTQELESTIGKGKVFIGGHPNSARGWILKDHSLITDAFERDGNKYFIDYFEIQGNKGDVFEGLPLRSNLRSPLNNLKFGDTISKCAAILKQHGLSLTVTKRGLERTDRVLTTYKGHLTERTYKLIFSGEKTLNSVHITVGFRRDEEIGLSSN